MKNLKLSYLIAGLIAIFSAVSCDYLDKQPDDQLDLETAFENRTNLERWLAYIYNGIPDFYHYDGAISIADDLTPPVGWESQGFKAILYQNGNFTPAQDGIISYWKEFSKRIRSAYIFIENAHPLFDVSAKEIEWMKAECRFFIAYYHAMLVTTYGAVPMITGPAQGTNASDMQLKQAPFYEVVDWVAQELKETSEILPASYEEANKYGRATSLMCLAVRARLLTFAASPLVNGNPDLAGMVNCDGTPLFSTEFDPERWRTAADANMEVIEAAKENGYELYVERLDNGSVDPYMSYMNAVLMRWDQGNHEVIFPKTYDSGAYFDRQCNPRSMGGAGAIGVTQNLVDAFFMSNGLVPITGYGENGQPIINPASGYTETGYSTADYKDDTKYFYAEQGAVEGQKTNHVITTKGTYNMYCNREPRFYISVLYNEQYHWGKDKHKSTNKYTDFFSGGQDGGPSHDAPTAGYLVRKMVDPSTIPSDGSGKFKTRHGAIYRLAEAYLSYAECLNEYSIAKGTYDANKNEILSYVNKIRERAGIPQYGTGVDSDGVEMIVPPTDGETLRDLIHRERRVELNCEAGNRFDDLRRWKEATTVLNGPFYGMDSRATKSNRDDYYKRTQYQTRRFISYWWPIPQDDIDKNVNLRQFPEW